MRKEITPALVLLFALLSVAAGVLINGNQINPQTAISISSMTVTGAGGETVTNGVTASSFTALGNGFSGAATGLTGSAAIAVLNALTTISHVFTVTSGSVTIQSGSFSVASSTFNISGGIITGGSQPTATLRRASSQNIVNSGGGSYVFWGTQENLVGLINVASSSGTVTVPTGGAGVYVITCSVEFAPGGTNTREIWIDINGVSKSEAAAATEADGLVLSVSEIIKLADADAVRCTAFTDGGATTICTNNGCRLGMVKAW